MAVSLRTTVAWSDDVLRVLGLRSCLVVLMSMVVLVVILMVVVVMVVSDHLSGERCLRSRLHSFQLGAHYASESLQATRRSRCSCFGQERNSQ